MISSTESGILSIFRYNSRKCVALSFKDYPSMINIKLEQVLQRIEIIRLLDFLTHAIVRRKEQYRKGFVQT